MENMVHFFFTSSLVLFFLASCVLKTRCACDAADPRQTVNVVIKSRRNELGKWVIEFDSGGEAEQLADGMTLNISTTLSNCGDVEFANIRGSLEVDYRKTAIKTTEVTTKKPHEPLTFSNRTDKFVELSNGFRTARRIKASEEFRWARVITDRPLGNEELFEVTLEDTGTIWAGSIMVGVTRLSSDSFNYENYCESENIKCGLWIYSDDQELLKVGDRVGVMKYANGTLHIFVNSKLSISYDDVPETVYGYVELYGDAVQASITSP